MNMTDNHTFLKENEIMIDGSCYDSRKVKVVRCTECNVKCVDTETVDGVCVDCCGRIIVFITILTK